MGNAINPGAASWTYRGYAPLVVQSYSTAGAIPLPSTTLRQLFPSQRVPIDGQGNTWSNEWYRYLDYQANYLVAGVNAIPVNDIINAINTANSNLARLQSLTVAVNAMANQNAAALTSVVNVVQGTATPETILPVQPIIQGGGGD